MSEQMDVIRNAILDGQRAELADLEMPSKYSAAVVRREDEHMFDGVESSNKDPEKSLRIEEIDLPELAPDEAYVAVMASSINFNTVWTSIFEPVSTFGALDRLGKESYWGARHSQDFHAVGSDASGVVLRVGSAVRRWKPGDEVVIHCNHVDDQDPTAHDDSMMASNQRIWGYETNYGGLGEITLAKANQIMPKPAHLTWEEAAVNALTNSTSYRMLVSPNGARMSQGDTVLIWGASGGIGAYAVQYVLNGGGTPVCVVSSPERAELCRKMGAEHVIDRRAEGYQFWKDENTQDPSEWKRFGKKIRELVGVDLNIVFEHPGRSTMGASVFVARKGGTIVTCAATSGFMLEFDNRYLWMFQKRIQGSHFANYREASEANRLICEGKIHPVMSAVYPLEQVGVAARAVQRNEHEGKLGILVLSPEEGLGVSDPDMRAAHIDEITRFRS